MVKKLTKAQIAKWLNTQIKAKEMQAQTLEDEDVRFNAFFPDQAIDTRRADAIFIGAFISMIKDGHKMIESIDFARGAASLSCTRRGTYESIPERAEVLKLIKREDLL